MHYLAVSNEVFHFSNKTSCYRRVVLGTALINIGTAFLRWVGVNYHYYTLSCFLPYTFKHFGDGITGQLFQSALGNDAPNPSIFRTKWRSPPFQVPFRHNQHLRQFTQKHLKDEIAHSCSHPNAKKLYKTILEQSYLTSDDIIPLIPLQEFEKVFVSSDILCLDQNLEVVSSADTSIILGPTLRPLGWLPVASALWRYSRW